MGRAKPGTKGSKPVWTLRLPEAVSVAMVLPWNAPFITMTDGGFNPFLCPNKRDNLMAASLASAPNWQKRPVPCPIYESDFQPVVPVRRYETHWGMQRPPTFVLNGFSPGCMPKTAYTAIPLKLSISMACLIIQPNLFPMSKEREADYKWWRDSDTSDNLFSNKPQFTKDQKAFKYIGRALR